MSVQLMPAPYTSMKKNLFSSMDIAINTQENLLSVDIKTRTFPAKNPGPNHSGYIKIPPMAVSPVTKHSGM